MTLFIPFRIELNFEDERQYTPKAMRSDGLAFSREIEQRLEEQFFDDRDMPAAVYVESHVGSLIHWGYFTFSEVFADLAATATLIGLLRNAVDDFYALQLLSSDVRIGQPYWSETATTKELKEQFQSFWRHKVGSSATSIEPIVRESQIQSEQIKSQASHVRARLFVTAFGIIFLFAYFMLSFFIPTKSKNADVVEALHSLEQTIIMGENVTEDRSEWREMIKSLREQTNSLDKRISLLEANRHVNVGGTAARDSASYTVESSEGTKIIRFRQEQKEDGQN